MKKQNDESFSYEDIVGSVSPKGVLIAQRMLLDSLEPIKKLFNEYRVVPFCITRASSLHFYLEYDPAREHGTEEFTRGGAWWAYRFGFSEDLHPNDFPNISIGASRTGLDVALNAELIPSQEAMLHRIKESTPNFDGLLAHHGVLWLKTYRKLEHKPKGYHWILTDFMSPREFDGEDILRLWHKHENTFWKERERWIRYIIAENKELTPRQIHHLETRTKQLNLAIRLVEPFQKSATFWSLKYEQQVMEIIGAVERMKPLLDFFLK